MTIKSMPEEPVYFDHFIAIDFETADYGRDSACAIGLIVVDKGKIVKQYSSLIRPPRPCFQFTWLHGISWKDVADKPSFGELWPEIAPLFEDAEFIAAHHASFDRGVLTECCSLCNCAPAIDKYLCTVRLARRLWDIKPTKLSDVCDRFGISLDHHRAESDALACAKIVLRAYTTGIPEKAFLKAAKKRKQSSSDAIVG